ncbi:MAG: SDR family NAD(P)-dependent oxidoreductase [Clostridiales bacterium]|nr:SDR family NAD(P)-dependent oxidoreductase [Clostridiales bacterium]
MKYAVITGASSGIGLAASVELAQKGYAVIGVGRDEARCEQAALQIRAAAPDANIRFLCADLMQQREVARVAHEITEILLQEHEGKLDALINNAGCVRSWYTTTEEGYEQQFALNHLAGFLLTWFLLSQLGRAGGRVLMTGSESHKQFRMRWHDVMFSRGYNPLAAYKQSKLSNILFARGLNDRYQKDGVRAYVVDPGLVCTEIGCKNTGGLVNWIWNMRKKHGAQPEVPAGTYGYLCETEPAPEELYYYRCKPNRYSKQVTRENADRLFALSERLCGVEYPSAIVTEKEKTI